MFLLTLSGHTDMKKIFEKLQTGSYEIVFIKQNQTSWRFPDLHWGKNTEIPSITNSSRKINIIKRVPISFVNERCLQVYYKNPILVQRLSWLYETGIKARSFIYGDLDSDLIINLGGGIDLDISKEYYLHYIDLQRGVW